MHATCVGDTDTRRSHTGYILIMSGGPISWTSRRQDNVSLSTSEAKFVMASQAGQEAMYLREMLTDFGYSQTISTLSYIHSSLRRQSCLRCYEQESGAPEILSSHRHQTILHAQTRPGWVSQARPFVQRTKWWLTPSPRACHHQHSSGTDRI